MDQFCIIEDDYVREITDVHLEEFTHAHGKDWRLLPAHLEMDGIIVSDLERQPGGERERRHTFFTKWKFLKGSGATYEKLVYGLLKVGDRQGAEAVCELLKRYQALTSSGSSASAQEGIISCFCSLLHS